MKIVAPLVLLAVFSVALYKTQEIWPKADYEAAFGGSKAGAASASAASASGGAV